MDRATIRLVAIGLAAGICAALTTPSGAAASDPDDYALDGIADYAPPEMLAAMERDLGLATDEALAALATDAAASDTEQALRTSLDTSFGGAWLDEDQQLVVAVTDTTQAGEVRAAGASPELVTHSESELDDTMAALDSAPAPDASEVYGWHVDVATNSVVVHAAPGAEDVAGEFIAASDLTGSGGETPVRIEVPATGAPQLYPDLIGGHPYYFGSSRCSIGFPVLPAGFVTAGHCGNVGTATRGFDGSNQGVIAASDFPGADAGYVSVNANWTPQPWVWAYSGNQVFVVQGSQAASVGAATCRSGSTTGWQCGTILALNQTVNYAEGTVTGLTATSACAERGDSGGSFVAANGQAQGVTSGGSGNCTFGGTTFFQPVNPILNAYGLTLVTG